MPPRAPYSDWAVSCSKFGPAIVEFSIKLLPPAVSKAHQRNNIFSGGFTIAALLLGVVLFVRADIHEVRLAFRLRLAKHLNFHCHCSLSHRWQSAHLGIYVTAAFGALIGSTIIFSLLRKTLFSSVVEGVCCDEVQCLTSRRVQSIGWYHARINRIGSCCPRCWTSANVNF
jgi:hypothetical protein